MKIIKYTLEGLAVEVHSSVAGGHVVSFMYETEDGDDGGAPQFLDAKLYDKPPVEKREKQIEELHQRIDELVLKRTALDEDLRQAEAGHKRLMDKLKHVPALAMLEDFIDGKITHFVCNPGWGGPDIVDFKEEMEVGKDYPDKLKLLSLYGDSRGDFMWRTSAYHDGSGSKRDVYPCTSLEMAEAKAKELTETNALASNNQPRDFVIAAAKKYGATLPDGYERRFLESCIGSNTDAVTKEQSNLDDRKASIETMKERLSVLTNASRI